MLFDKGIDTTENNVAVKMWSMNLERLFRRATLRKKNVESVSDSREATSNSSSKVDHISQDTLLQRRNEADETNAEIMKRNVSLIRATSERTKPHSESKVVLDKMTREVSKKNE